MHCETCKYFNVVETECRRYAPQPAKDRAHGRWPAVAAEDWCGEYVARRAAPKKKAA
ncbi:MAG: hypothetical protein AAGH87_04530 [Pseudomonadota bacterium]